MRSTMKNTTKEMPMNMRIADDIWGPLSKPARIRLRELIVRYGLSVAAGDLQYLDARWYVTHAGLLRLAQRKHCTGISVCQVRDFCDPGTCRWVFKATVYKRTGSKGFAGYGDADPSNVSPLVRGAEMRVAETRAVNRALRKAYGIGLCSVEEIGSAPNGIERLPPQSANVATGMVRARRSAIASARSSASTNSTLS